MKTVGVGSFGRRNPHTCGFLLPGCWEVQFPCNKKEVRQALDYAIDKDLIINSLYGPEAAASRGWNWATPNALGYSEDLDPFPMIPTWPNS